MTDFEHHTLAGLLDHIDDAVVSVDERGIVQVWNRAAQAVFGVARDGALGQPLREVVGTDLDRLTHAAMAAEPGPESPRERIGEVTVRRCDGSSCALEVSVVRLREAGCGGSFALVARDISRRRAAARELAESRERLELALEAARLGTWEWDIVADRIVWSGQAGSLYGVSPSLKETSSLDFLEAVDLADRGRVAMAIAAARDHGQSFRVEFRGRWPDGTWHWLEISGRVLRSDAAGDRVVGVMADIDERKHAETEREQSLAREQSARAQAEAANRAKDEFLSVLSHELRTPLNTITGWAELMESGDLEPPEASRAVETILRNARLQTRLVEDLIDVSRIVTGRLRLEPRNVRLVEPVMAAVSAISFAAREKGVRLEAKCDPGIGSVWGDAARLTQVVTNLLANAVKFTPEGGLIELTLRNDEDAAILAVRDSGEGISEEFLSRVFDRFWMADSSTTRSHGGLGLGLTIVQHIVEQHGGRVWAESGGPGRGALFTVTLPTRAGAARPRRLSS